jgi:8-hydroxy-5-deazaflavin:NADPH oxidoreductase
MDIGIIGTGNIGGTAARLLVRAGHRVMLANSRGPGSLTGLVRELGANARAGTVEEVARFGQVVLEAIPFGRYRELPAQEFAGKVVIDASNYYPDRDGHFPELDSDAATSSELIAAHLRGARVVKAFNTMYFKVLGSEGRPRGDPRRLTHLMAGDDAEAKRAVAHLVDQMGFDVVDTGGLAEGGRRQQPGTPAYARPLTAEQVREMLGLAGPGAEATQPGA